MLVVEHVQEVVCIHSSSVLDWVGAYKDLIAHQDAQQGYFFMLAREKLGSSYPKLAEAIGVSPKLIQQKVAFFKALKELEEKAPEKELPPVSTKYRSLIGKTPEEKADNYALVKTVTGKAEPTRVQIKEVMQTIKKPVELVQPSNLKEILNEKGYPGIPNLKEILVGGKQIKKFKPDSISMLESLINGTDAKVKKPLQLLMRYK